MKCEAGAKVHNFTSRSVHYNEFQTRANLYMLLVDYSRSYPRNPAYLHVVSILGFRGFQHNNCLDLLGRQKSKNPR
jgi:hypothetical protein